MDRDITLPPKISIKQVQSYLGMPVNNANQLLCEYVNNDDFPLYKQGGTRVENIAYKYPSLFDDDYDPENIKPFIVDGTTYPEDDFYCCREEIYKFRRGDIRQDNVNAKPDNSAEYLDPDSPYYAEEMHLAAQIHKAIYIDKFGDFNTDRLGTVEAWLNKNKPDLQLSDAMIKRLSTIIRNKK